MSDLISNIGLQSELPEPAQCQVWLDFDGTVTRKDVLDELIKRYSVNDSWQIVEQRWQAGLIGSRQCLKEQFALLRVSADELNSTLDSIELDDGIFPLLKLLESFSVPVAVLSDSVDSFISRILQRHGISNLRFRSNAAVHRGVNLELCCPHMNRDCLVDAAHCKCASARALGDINRKSIYIGDGRSDLCPARKSDYVFAKNALAQCLKSQSVKFTEYRTLHDVTRILCNSWHARIDNLKSKCGIGEQTKQI